MDRGSRGARNDLGIVLGRWFSLAITLGTLIVIAWRAPHPGKAALAALGLSLCPYFLGVGFHLYTDGIATFLAVLAIRQHLQSRFTSSAVAWVLAVSTRQYVVALAAGAFAYECFRYREHGAWTRIASPLAGCLTLAGWMLFWGGLGPAPALLDNTGGATIAAAHPEYGLYALACLGAYHVIPETFLMGERFAMLRRAERRTLFMMAFVLALAFVWFPPLQNPIFVPTMGYLDLAARRLVRDDRLRMVLFFGLSLLAAHRWCRNRDLGCWLVLAQVGLMSLALVAWDKYSLPLVASLWFLSAWRAIIPPMRAANVDQVGEASHK